MAYGGARRALPLPHRGTGMAGVGGRVFYDRDGDGRYGAGDRALRGATVRIGSVSVKTAEDGSYRGDQQTWIPGRLHDHIHHQVRFLRVREVHLRPRFAPRSGNGVETSATTHI